MMRASRGQFFRAVAGVAFGATLMLGAGPSVAQEGATAELPDSEDARAILADMGRFLASQKKFRVEILAAHDAVQPSGQKIEFVDKRTVTISRPDKLRVDVVRSDGEESRVIMNSRTITAQNLDEGVYAQTEARDSIDASIAHFVRDLGMKLPLAMLLVSDLPEQLERRVVQADFVENTEVFGHTAWHIAGSTDSIDFQIWVQASNRPVPVRIVLTYRNAPGEPQFRAQFTDWDFSPCLRSSTFEPDIDAGDKQIAFLSQVKARAAASASQGAVR